MLEKQIEKTVCDYAKLKGFLVYKFSSPAHRGVPDRMFITQEGHVFFIEFKRKGNKPTPIQEREIKKLIDHGVKAFVVDDVDSGKKLIDDANT